MDKGCSLQNPGHIVENSRGSAGNYGEYPSFGLPEMGGINVAPWRVRDALVRGVINKQGSFMSGWLRMRHWMHPTPLKKSGEVLHKET